MEWFPIAQVFLSVLAPLQGQWESIESNSEQRQPIYYGASPRELSLHAKPRTASSVELPLKVLFEAYSKELATALKPLVGSFPVELEVWPVDDDYGQRMWAIARYRSSGKVPWVWIPEGAPNNAELNKLKEEENFQFPEFIESSKPKNLLSLFGDFLNFDSLIDKPSFGDCVWTNLKGDQSVGGWLRPEFMKATESKMLSFSASEKPVCRKLFQPPRNRDQAFTWVIGLSEDGKVRWPKGAKFHKPLSEPKITKAYSRPLLKVSSENLPKLYLKDLEVLTGVTPVLVKGESVTFKKKNSVESDHQLESLVDYLESRYAELGISTIRQRFQWREIQQSNLIAVIKGSLPRSKNRAVILSDHIDTAFAEDVYKEKKVRESVPGADDNATATAALLRAALIYSRITPKNDIWLVHLTGEEFPADSLGARKFISAFLRRDAALSGLLGRATDIGGVIQLDMIGYTDDPKPFFQISVGEGKVSQELGVLAHSIGQTTDFAPEYRSRFDEKSYLYNTDGIVFSNNGFPVILINEHLNALENLNRPHYHESSDVIQHLNIPYALTLTEVAIQTAWIWANR